MTRLSYRDQTIEVAPDETALDALLRAGVDAPRGCRAGVCQSCMQRVVEGAPPPAAQEGLSEAQKAMGYFLPCVCVVETPLRIAPIDDAR
ncbi:MAG: 2Fe-2S iron-sulfur cluster binding domain-containing protein [Methylocystis sp.]